MAEWLLLRLAHGEREPVSWMAADAHGQPIAAPQVGSLQQAAAAADGRRLAVVVPAGDVLMTEVDLPVKSAGVRVQQVVPYALEEQLAADVETLHFALGARDAQTGHTAVAVVTRALMGQWLTTLAAAGLTAEVLCTEAALLPDNPGHVVVTLDADTLCLRRAGQSALVLPALDIAAALTAALGAQLMAENLIFYASPEDWQRRSAEVEALRSRCASLKVQLLNFGPLPLLSPQLAAGAALNLLDGDYAPKHTLGAGRRQWRVAAMLAGILLLLHIGGLTLQLQQQRHSERSLDEALGAIARRVIPGDPGTGELRQRIERRLLAAQAGVGGSGLIPALTALAQAVQGSSGTAVEALSFQKDGLDLKLKTANAEDLQHIDDSLRSNGWQAELTSGNSAGAAYEGHIQARAPGAGATP